MTRDAVIIAVVVVAFALLLTVHVALAFGLARRTRAWRGALALVLVPLAPWWGWRERMRVRGALWIVAALVYVVALCLALQ